MRTPAQKVHRCTKRYFINETLRDEIAAIRAIIDLASGVALESAIGHMIERVVKSNSYGDSCMYGGGGYCIHFKY